MINYTAEGNTGMIGSIAYVYEHPTGQIVKKFHPVMNGTHIDNSHHRWAQLLARHLNAGGGFDGLRLRRSRLLLAVRTGRSASGIAL